MKNFLRNFFLQQFFTGSLVMFFGSSLVNFGNYLFHLIIARMLGPAGYGILQSLISSLYLLGIIPLSFGVILVKYFSSLKGKGDESMLGNFYYWSRKQLLFLGIGVAFFLTAVVPFWSSFLKLSDSRPLVLAIASFPLALLLIHIRSYFSGVLDFVSYNINVGLEVIFKIILSVILVFFGWQVFGATLGMLLASLISYLLSSYFIKLKRPEKLIFTQKRELLSFYFPALISTLSLTSLYSNDIILVKHFFSDTSTGIYAAVSILGKVIFYASSSLIFVMFPMVSQKQAKGENFRHTFWLTFFFVGLISLLITTIYFLFPTLMLRLLFGHRFLAGASLLFIFGIFISVYSLANVLINYFLSLGKTRMAIFPLFAAILQIVLITFWHRELSFIIYDSLVATFLLLVSLLIYYRYEGRR